MNIRMSSHHPPSVIACIQPDSTELRHACNWTNSHAAANSARGLLAASDAVLCLRIAAIQVRHLTDIDELLVRV